MTKSSEKLPVQFYIQHFQLGDDQGAGEDADEPLTLTTNVTSSLTASYQILWDVLTGFATNARSGASREQFASKYFFEAHEIAGHPNVFLRCQLVNEKWLALILEKTIQEPFFSGRAGLILGARGAWKAVLQQQKHAQPTIELDLTASPRLFHVHSSALQSHADDLLARLASSPTEIARIHEWFEETEKVVTVPESSLRETTRWLRETNDELAAERQASQAAAESQKDAFMRLFASLANSRVGA